MTELATFLVDFHCHLDLYPDFADIVREANEARVKTLAVTTTPRAFPRNLELTRHTRHVRAALGLHPQLVRESASEIDRFAELLPLTRYVGEVGLDASPRYYASFAAQQRVFATILELCAAAGDKIISLHSVRAVSPVLDLIEGKLPAGRGKVVLHWFTGGAAEARRAVQLGCYFSINAEMLHNTRHRQTLAKEIPIGRLLTETDGPFVQNRGRAIRPTDVQETVTELAVLMGTTPAGMRAQIVHNLNQLLIFPRET